MGNPPDGVCDRKLAENLHLVTAPVFDWPDMALPAGEGRVSCLGMRDHFGILADGTVVPCCLDSEGMVALGNAFERPLGRFSIPPAPGRSRTASPADRHGRALQAVRLRAPLLTGGTAMEFSAEAVPAASARRP